MPASLPLALDRLLARLRLAWRRISRPFRSWLSKRALPVALDVPTIVRVASTQPRVSSRDDTPGKAQAAPLPANDARKAAIVTAKSPHRRGRFGDVPDITPEEHKARGDAADELMRRFKREIAGKLREG